MKFDYVEINSQIARPLIIVKISFEQKFLVTEALIDSGSDYCIFPIEAAQALHIPIEKAFSITSKSALTMLEIKFLLRFSLLNQLTNHFYEPSSSRDGTLGFSCRARNIWLINKAMSFSSHEVIIVYDFSKPIS